MKGQYKDFSYNFQSSMWAQRIPLNGSIEITENCNFRCLHCYQGMKKSKSLLSFKQWAKILDEMAAEGCFWLLITGGEPLLHPEFEKIYHYAIHKGFMVTLFTNARLIKQKHLDLFCELPPFAIEVTFYGMSEEMYQKTTGTKGSFAKVIENCRKMKSLNLPLKMKSVAFKPLYKDIPAMRKFVESDIGVEFKFDTKIDPTIYGDPLNSIRLSPEETIALEDEVVGGEAIASDLEIFRKVNTKVRGSKYLYNCGAGKSSFYIDYKGQLNTCSIGRLNRKEFDLTKHSFKKLWFEEMPKEIFRQVRNKNRICDNCDYRSICDVCPATSKLATGSKEGRPLYICQHTMARKEKFLKAQNHSTNHETTNPKMESAHV